MSEPAATEYPVLTAPAAGTPELTDTDYALRKATAALNRPGPLAVDTERAQSFRYTGKAYLIQLRRGDGPTVLLDPTAFEYGAPRADLSKLAAGLADAEWIIHAATNDLPCLAEVRFLPARLFDTELAARLLGFERVNLSALMEHFLGVGLAKKFSAEDWSARPLPRSWRTYAALDVERLADLRDALAAELEAAGRLDIALQEFAHLAAHAADPPAVHPDPWRRTANIHLVHTQRGLAVVRELWLTRDAIARRTDTAPSKILVDKGITELAAQLERAKKVAAGDLLNLPAFARKGAKPYLKDWADAANRALALPDSQLPTRSRGKEPHAQQWRWKKSFPQLAARYDRVREEVSALAERTRIPVVQLLEPDLLRRVLWETKDGGPADAVALLAQLDARHWQIELVAPILAAHWR